MSTIKPLESAPTKFQKVGDIRFAYREVGDASGVPVIFLNHLGAVLDNFDPRNRRRPRGHFNRRTVMSTANNEPVITSYAKAPARTIAAGGVTFAYRELGPKGGIPVIFFVHLAATLDNWDPRIIDPIAKHRHVIAFDNRGVGASTGQVPDTVEAMADDAYTFINALGFSKIDIFSFSLGGMVAQDFVVKHPNFVRKLILTGTGPRGGKDIDKVAGTTYFDMLRATLTLSDPKEFLFFNRNAAGKLAARAFVNRLKERTVDRDALIKVKAFRTQLKAIQKYGRSAPSDLSKLTQPTLIANGDNDRMVPSTLSEDLHRRIKHSELIIYPDSGMVGFSSFTRNSRLSPWSSSRHEHSTNKPGRSNRDCGASIHQEILRLVDSSVGAHRPASTKGDGLLEGAALQDHQRDPRL